MTWLILLNTLGIMINQLSIVQNMVIVLLSCLLIYDLNVQTMLIFTVWNLFTLRYQIQKLSFSLIVENLLLIMFMVNIFIFSKQQQDSSFDILPYFSETYRLERWEIDDAVMSLVYFNGLLSIDLVIYLLKMAFALVKPN